MTSYTIKEIEKNIKFLEDGEVELITIPVAILRSISPNVIERQIRKDYYNRPDIKEERKLYYKKYNPEYYKKHREAILQKKKEKRMKTFKNIASQE